MQRTLIVVGDRLDHGGVVVSGTPFTDIDGKPVARIGDRVVCERHGPTNIVTGDSTFIVDGRPVARHGDKTACGGTLLAAGQGLVMTDTGSALGVAAAAAPAAAATMRPAAAQDATSTMQFNQGRTPGDPQKARDAVRDANAALRDAGMFRPYDSEVEAAQAWRQHVLPVADDHDVEIGAVITRRPDGLYHLGGAYSSGSYDHIEALYEKAPRTAGTTTALVHTHPYGGGWVGRDRSFMMGELPDEYGTGGRNEGGDNRGDLVTAYFQRINTYVADADGLHGWNYAEYRALQERAPYANVRLGEAYRTYGP